ncbi:tRNA lysidine(34) synthetase TilS [Crenobacter sp. SG2305]|uniref:tRNA lysidine(34) synthetase TilS n=1 Tax=Crenobacter oryzisoli TaxID=3056844 RepID=UPI0025AAB8A2|nr:tRNA lysidine(34) synthetase TilS [Crenobacter sp. SG2305]MDN0082036.1 tRNA lysidine(34) synthetase TilS [Crenobacter sp. SG2305]
MMKMPDLLQRLIKEWPETLSGHFTLELALSGGLDSVVLLDLLLQARAHQCFTLSAVHVHHGLSPNADAWSEHCRALCEARAVPLRIERVQVIPDGDGVEAAARRARYQVLASSSANVVALAQHQDDQAETVLLQALRGGGPHALAAMPRWRALTPAIDLWRPLLGIRRDELETYAVAQGLRWVDDESNTDPRYRRNWLRHHWLPVLAAELPDYRAQLQRTASQLADAAALLDELAEQDLAQAVRGGRLQLAELTRLSEPRQRQLLLRWVERSGLGSATPESVEAFRRQLLTARSDATPQWRLSRGLVHRYRGELWPDAGSASPQCQYLSSAVLTTPVALPDWQGVLAFEPRKGGLRSELIEQGLWLQPRQGGERLALKVGRKPVKTLLQEAGVPPFLRERWPLLVDAGGECVALPGVEVANTAQSDDGWWPLWTPALGPQIDAG